MKVLEVIGFTMMFAGAGSYDAIGFLGGLIAIAGGLILAACAHKEEMNKEERRQRARRYS